MKPGLFEPNDEHSTCDIDLARWLSKQSNADLETIAKDRVPDELFQRAWQELFLRHRTDARLVEHRERRQRR